MKQYFRERKERLILGITRNLDFPPHIHEELELVYMLRGSCIACCTDQEYRLQQGDYFLAFPEQVHYYRESNNCKAFLIIVNPARLTEMRSVFTHKTPISPVYSGEELRLTELLRLSVEEHQDQADPDVTLCLLTAALRKLLKHYKFHSEPHTDSTTAQIIKYCSSHYREPLSVASLSKALYLSQSHISHTFSEKLKISFSDYVNSLRLDMAVHLLERGDLSMEHIAETAGFPTVRTFNRVFRNKYGMSPRDYKKSGL